MKEQTKFQITVTQDCLECGKRFKFKFLPEITSTMQRYKEGELTAFCHAKPNDYSNCVREYCPYCHTFYTLDIGAMEFHCHPE